MSKRYMTKRKYRTKEVMGLLGITYRQLQYWDQTGLLCPSSTIVTSSREFRAYVREDFVILWIIKNLRGYGYSIQKLREIVPFIRKTLSSRRQALSDYRLMIYDGSLLIFTGEVHFHDGLVGSLEFLNLMAPCQMLDRETEESNG